jgi:hypothetical protein
VQLGEEGNGRSRSFHFLYRGIRPLVRSDDPRRLVRALAAHLLGHARPESTDALEVDALALVGDGFAVLAPAELRYHLPSIERRLAAGGLRVVDEPLASIDPDRGELVVATPAAEVDWSALEDLSAAARPSTPVPAGRFPIAGWAFGLGRDRAGPLARAHAVALSGRLTRNASALGMSKVLAGLATVMRRIEPVAIWADKAEALAAPLLAVPRGVGRHG